MTVVPFDGQLSHTRRVLARFGYDLYDDPTLAAMDNLGARYWPRDSRRPHAMRKFCAFWGPYERFFFLDADIVVLHPLEVYFDAFRRLDVDFMYLATAVSGVYRAGPVRDEMVSRYHTAGFNSGTFLGRRGTLSTDMLNELATTAVSYRHGFVDNLEQTFINYAVDMAPLSKADAHTAIPDLVEAGALMRLKSKDGQFFLADARTPAVSGRPVSMIHWAGYNITPFMPYRRTFLAFRLARATRWQRLRYHVECFVGAARKATWKTPVRFVRRWRVLGRNILASRGVIGWED
jgi:hypothetical protein